MSSADIQTNIKLPIFNKSQKVFNYELHVHYSGVGELYIS